MNRNITRRLCAVWSILVALFILPSNTAADSGSVGLGEFGLKGGQVRGGTIEFSPGSGSAIMDSVEIDAGFSGGAFIDHPFFRLLHITAAFDFH